MVSRMTIYARPCDPNVRDICLVNVDEKHLRDLICRRFSQHGLFFDHPVTNKSNLLILIISERVVP